MKRTSKYVGNGHTCTGLSIRKGRPSIFCSEPIGDKAAAASFFEKAMRQNGTPEKVTMDKSGANKAAMDDLNTDREVPITVRQIKYLNNIVEQDHRAVKRITKPMMGFKSFRAAGHVLAGIELMHMIRKGQMIR